RLKVLPTLQDFIKADINDPLKEKYFTKTNIVGPRDLEISIKRLYDQKPLMELVDLNTSFTQSTGLFWRKAKTLKAVDSVSFNLYEGEVLGLVGESGSGKSTLARTITKLVKASKGSIVYKGNDIVKFSEKEFRPLRKEIQIIFQDPYASLNPRMRIGEAIVEPMIVHGLNGNKINRKEKAIELLKSVGLDEDAFYKYPHEFSGGQRQRVSIARALSVEPKVLICDECVSALDVNVQAQVLNLLVKLKDEFNLTYLFITHDLSVVRFISDRIMVMKHGKIEELGLAEQVFNHPHSSYTKELLDAVPKVDFDKWL
ncbi:MAG TPA: ATP-binding cassette domain-containing protein, partial [Saprospiraceae bacterium]|nr:ATP-binding cassette domain-containing protein [Saprospiraceae bacterium]